MRISIIYQLKRGPSEIKVSTDCNHLNHRLSEAKSWPVILVSECQKGGKRLFVRGVTAKGTPTQMNKSLEEASEKMQ